MGSTAQKLGRELPRMALAAEEAMFEGLGAKLEALYMMPGSNWDFMMIVDGASAEIMAAIKKASQMQQ